MEQVIYTNRRGHTVTLGLNAPYILTKVEGAGAVQADVRTLRAPYQDGEIWTGTSLEPRMLNIELMVLGADEREMARRRRALARVFNAKEAPGLLRYEKAGVVNEIKAVPEIAPVFPDAGGHKDAMQPAFISLICPNPFWLSAAEESMEMADWVGGLAFPLSLPTMFAGRSARLNKAVYNESDVETPIIIEFGGACLRPQVMNVDTGEFIRVDTSIGADEKLVISTHLGAKSVRLQNMTTGEEVSAFDLLDLDSTFFKLAPGDNQLSYDAEEGKGSAKVRIRWRNRFVGV